MKFTTASALLGLFAVVGAENVRRRTEEDLCIKVTLTGTGG